MFNKGDLILTGTPFACALYTEERFKRCDHCFKLLETKLRCHHCNYVIYCSRQCQRDGKSEHSYECPFLAQRPLSTLTRLVTRIVGRLEKDANAFDMVNGTKRNWNDLMDHYEDVIHDSEAMFAFNRIYYDVESIFQREIDIVNLIKVYGKVLVNSFAIQDELMRPIGRAVYLGASIFDHSCDPNASFTFVGTRVYIKAIKDMQHKDFARIKISYLDELDTSEERVRQLFLHYYFVCDCERCNKRNFTRIDMSEDKVLRDIWDQLEDLAVDAVAVCESRCQLLKQGHRLANYDPEVLLNILDTEDKKKRGLRLLEKLERHRRSALSMRNVLSIRIADLISAFEGNVDLAMKVIDYFRAYYGRHHPRLALKLYLTAMTIRSNNVSKHKLLLEAKSVATICVPSTAQQLEAKKGQSIGQADQREDIWSRGRDRDRSRSHYRGRLGSPVNTVAAADTTAPITLLALIDKEINATQQQIHFKASLSNAKCKWRSQSSTREYHKHNQRELSLTRRPALKMF